jgi:hypothetical protein
MPIKTLSIAAAAERYAQGRKAALDKLDEWTQLKARLSAGIKSGEAVIVELPKNSTIRNLRSTFKRRTRNYVRKMKLGYDVRSMKDSSGVEVVIIENTGAPASPPPSRKR